MNDPKDPGPRYASPPCMAGEVTPDYFDTRAGKALIHQSGQANGIGNKAMALKHAASGERVDLHPLGSRVSTEKTIAIVRTKSFEAVRLIVLSGTEIPSHKVTGQIMFHCIEGHVQLGLADRTIDLLPGHWVYLDHEEHHALRGIQDSSLLMTILFDGG